MVNSVPPNRPCRTDRVLHSDGGRHVESFRKLPSKFILNDAEENDVVVGFFVNLNNRGDHFT